MLNIIAYIVNNKRNLKQFTQLVANIYQYKVENIILLNSTLRILLKNLIIISVFLAIIIVIFSIYKKIRQKGGSLLVPKAQFWFDFAQTFTGSYQGEEP